MQPSVHPGLHPLRLAQDQRQIMLSGVRTYPEIQAACSNRVASMMPRPGDSCALPSPSYTDSWDAECQFAVLYELGYSLFA